MLNERIIYRCALREIIPQLYKKELIGLLEFDIGTGYISWHPDELIKFIQGLGFRLNRWLELDMYAVYLKDHKSHEDIIKSGLNSIW